MKRILLSRTDSIGDVVLSIPMAGWLRSHYPGVEVDFLAKRYTAPILQTSEHLSEILELDELKAMEAGARRSLIEAKGYDAVVHVFPNAEVGEWCKRAGIPMRIGTAKRGHHWKTCTHRPWIGRRRSDLHEAQLNMRLLAPLGYAEPLGLDALAGLYGLTKVPDRSPTTSGFIKGGHFNLILHPRSLGSAREWGVGRFAELIRLLPAERFNIILTGTEAEGDTFRDELIEAGADSSPDHHNKVTDSTGALDLHQLNALIRSADGLIAASTGPLHIAAAMGIHALGLYIAKRPMHPGRWAPVGPKAEYLVYDDSDESLESITKISAERVAAVVEGWR